jgi:hypothetical protein
MGKSEMSQIAKTPTINLKEIWFWKVTICISPQCVDGFV